jgi:3-deoxy-D-arabino-heptulosonate 7-phosphate (DAHP) synthase
MDCQTLKPKGTKSGWNGFVNITENGRMVFGLEVTSKVFTNIHNVELGKPAALLI